MITNISVVPLYESASIYISYDRLVASASGNWTPVGEPGGRRILPIWDTGVQLISAAANLSPGKDYQLSVVVNHQDGSTDQGVLSFRTLSGPPAPTSLIVVNIQTGDDVNGTGSLANPYRTPQRALQSIAPGLAVALAPGVYDATVLGYMVTPISGLPNAWCHIVALDPANPPVLTGGAYLNSDVGTMVFANYGTSTTVMRYWRLADLVFRNLTSRAMWLGSPDLILERCTVERWGRGGISMGIGVYGAYGAGRISIHDCLFIDEDDNLNTDSPIFIWRGGLGQYSFLNNVFRLRNSVGRMDSVFTGPEGDGTGGWHKDSEYAHNQIYGSPDDGWQIDGGAVACRFWDNLTVDCFRGFSAAPLVAGPTWVFRNRHYVSPNHFSRHWNDAGTAWIKLGKTGHRGPLFLYNNTFFADTPVNNGGLFVGVMHDGSAPNTRSSNNVVIAAGRVAYLWFSGSPQFWNYDALGTRKWSGYFARLSGIGTVPDLASVQQQTGQELNGVDLGDGTLALMNPAALDFTPRPGSPLIDRGIDIPGVTDGFIGTAPDIGAVESGAGVARPVAAFTANPTQGLAPLTVTFTDQSA